jgi:hypothetical protein
LVESATVVLINTERRENGGLVSLSFFDTGDESKGQGFSGWRGSTYDPLITWRVLVLLLCNSYIARGPHIRHFPSRLLCRHWMQMVEGSTLDNSTHFSV